MENMLVPEIFFSMKKMLNQECRMLIGSIFIAASIVAVALTTLCLIFSSIRKFFSAKRSNPNPEHIELSEATRIENRDALSAEVSSIDASAAETERLAEKQEAERERATSSSIRSVPGMNGYEECDRRDASRILHPERESVRGAVRVRDASRRDQGRESGRVIYARLTTTTSNPCL